MTIGESLSCLRVKRNISQTELANALGVSRIMVSRWENDVSRPSGKNLLRICSFYEINSDYFADCTDAAPQEEPMDLPREEVLDLPREEVSDLPQAASGLSTAALLLELRELRQELAEKEHRDFGRRKRVAIILLTICTLFFIAMTIRIGLALYNASSLMYSAAPSPFANTEFTLAFIFSVLFGLGIAAVAIFWREHPSETEK